MKIGINSFVTAFLLISVDADVYLYPLLAIPIFYIYIYIYSIYAKSFIFVCNMNSLQTSRCTTGSVLTRTQMGRNMKEINYKQLGVSV